MLDIHLPPRDNIIDAVVNLPGSKSITNRVLLLAAIAHGDSIIHNVPDVAEDVLLMLKALKTLGVHIERLATNDYDSSSYLIKGCGGDFPNKKATIFCGNSGTTIRFLGAVLALSDGDYTLTGVARMKERPINDLIEALKALGADISYQEKDGYPPFRCGKFKDKHVKVVKLSGKTSSQYLTGLLLASPLLRRPLTIQIKDELISTPYVNITCALLEIFGVGVMTTDKQSFMLSGKTELTATEYTIEPDASSASYFLAMAALNGRVKCMHLSDMSLQGDKNFAKVLEKMGAEVTYASNYIEVSANSLNAITIDMQDMPDVAMTIAILAIFANGTTTITGIASWQVKETNRLAAITCELMKIGVGVSFTDSSITITPTHNIKEGAAIDTYNDHRMAMCFSLLATGALAVTIKDYHCVGKTFANYFDLFRKLNYKG